MHCFGRADASHGVGRLQGSLFFAHIDGAGAEGHAAETAIPEPRAAHYATHLVALRNGGYALWQIAVGAAVV